jgi:uncharacterized zinc-type alcohol dehydrogenase-like protein
MATATKSYAAQAADAALAPFGIERREPTDVDVAIDILFCGVCHSDLHTARNEWQMSVFPVVPGHEIVGRVSKVGAAVSKFKVGDLVGVGCMVDSCRTCAQCVKGLEQYCDSFPVLTYGGADKHTGGITYGGYSDAIVVDQDFVLKVPENLDLKAVAPLLCAGITMYSPMRHWGVKAGQKVGVVGLGGLGHMGVKFAHAMGAHTVVFTTSANKVEDALRLGADEVVLSTDAEQMKKHARSFDFIIDAVAAKHDINVYIDQLSVDGTLVQVGAPPEPLAVGVFGLIMGRRTFAGSLIGGIPETQEMLDFCGEHGITSDVEVIDIQQINEAYDRLVKSDVKYRFVIDMASIQK